MRPEEWLLIEWPEGQAKPAKYFLTTAPEEAALAQMVFVTKMRSRIEQDYQDLKWGFGLAPYEGRGWRGFHHHATLSIPTYGFLMAQRLDPGRDVGDKKLRRASGACRSQGLRPSGPSRAGSVTYRTRSRRCACA